MDNHKQVVKFCGVCGNERVYNDYHRLYNPCKTYVARNSARYHSANRDKIIARSKSNQENTRNVRKSHTQQIKDLNKKVEEITRAMELIFSKIE